MSREKLSFQSEEGRYLLAGFAIAIVAAVAVALTAYDDSSRSFNSLNWITHTGQVIGTLDAARGDSFAALAELLNHIVADLAKRDGYVLALLGQ